MKYTAAVLATLTIFLSASTILGQAEEPTQGEKVLQQFADVAIGEWVAVSMNGEPIEPAGGLTKKAEWAFEGKALSRETFFTRQDGENRVWKTLTTWDSREKVLRGFTVVNFDIGFVDRTTELRDGKWVTESTIISIQGVRERRTRTLTIENGGNTHIWTTTGGEGADRTITWKRVDPKEDDKNDDE